MIRKPILRKLSNIVFYHSAVTGDELDVISNNVSLPNFVPTWGFVATWDGVAFHPAGGSVPVKSLFSVQKAV